MGKPDDKKDKDDRMLQSEEHTLFKKNVSEKTVLKSGGLYKKTPAYTEYRMFMSSFTERKKGLHSVFNELWNSDNVDKLELRINSRGGFTNEGGQFYSLIKNKFNGRCTTILDSIGYSMGALVFMMGDKRIITARSELVIHDYSGGVIGKGNEIKAQFEHTQDSIRGFMKDVILDPGFLSNDEFGMMVIGQDYWMNGLEMCKRGIATHILIDGKEEKAYKYLARVEYIKKFKNNPHKNSEIFKSMVKKHKEKIKHYLKSNRKSIKV